MLVSIKTFHVFTIPNGSSLNTEKGREGGRKARRKAERQKKGRKAIQFVGLWRMKPVTGVVRTLRG